jgi:Barstar (barnase inhibitor)
LRSRAAWRREIVRSRDGSDFYGRNINAWLDCLAYEDDGMTDYPVTPGDVLTLQLVGCSEFRARRSEIYEVLIHAASFVNWHRIELGDPAILALSYR